MKTRVVMHLTCLLAFALIAAGCSKSVATTQPNTGSKIGFVMVGKQDDLGYNEAVYEGSVAVARSFPDNEVLRSYEIPETGDASKNAMESMIKRGAKTIFATSYGYRDAAIEVAKAHPEVVVVHQGGVDTATDLRNFGTYWGSIYEPVFQAGIAAAHASKSGKLGFVVAFPIPPVIANVNAFTLGAQSVNPRATTQVSFTGSWCDQTKQTAAAKTLIGAGVDVLAQHQDCTAAVLKAAEDAGIASIGYHYDASEVAPNSWLVGAVWNWRDLYVDIVRTVHSGKFAGSKYNGEFRGSLKDGNNPFVVTEGGKRLTADASSAMKNAQDRFTAGASPFQGPLSDREGVVRIQAGKVLSQTEIDASMNFFVPGVIGDLPSK